MCSMKFNHSLSISDREARHDIDCEHQRTKQVNEDLRHVGRLQVVRIERVGARVAGDE